MSNPKGKYPRAYCVSNHVSLMVNVGGVDVETPLTPSMALNLAEDLLKHGRVAYAKAQQHENISTD